MSYKKIRSICVVILLVVGTFLVVFSHGGSQSFLPDLNENRLFGSGNGTLENPYMINDIHELQAMKMDLSAHYALSNDIDASVTKNWNDGVGFEPIGDDNTPFTGKFDGKNHVISGLNIHRPETDNVGLFGFTNGSVVIDVGMDDETEVRGREWVGGLVGYNNGLISNAYSKGQIVGDTSIGGLVGRNGDGTVEYSYSTATVSGDVRVGGLIGFHKPVYDTAIVSRSFATGDVSSTTMSVGGFIGTSDPRWTNMYIHDCYATGNVTGVERVGGFIGRHQNWGWKTPLAYAEIKNCYSTGFVTGSTEVGGFMGSIRECLGVDLIENNFWDVDTSEISVSVEGTGETTVNMMDINTFANAGWDIFAVEDPNEPDDNHIWSIVQTDTYPFLRCVFQQEEENAAQWPMHRYDTQRSGRSPYTGPTNPGLEWTFETGAPIVSSPAIGFDGTIYFGSDDGNIYALNPDGSEKWSYPTGGKVRSSPAIGEDGTIYVGSFNSYFYALNPDGSLKWRFKTYGTVRSSAAIDMDGTIYIGSYDNYLYSINPDGTQRWRFYTGGDVLTPPAIGGDGTIYVGTWARKIFAVNPDGSEKWRFSANGPTHTSLAVGDDGTIYAGTWDPGNSLYAIDPDGSLKWRFDSTDQIRSSPAMGTDTTIYFGSYDYNFYAFNEDGSEKWHFTTSGAVRPSPVIDTNGNIYAGSRDNNIYALDHDGNELWRFATGGGLTSSPAIGENGVIYIGCTDHHLWAIGTGQNYVLDIEATEGGTTDPKPGTHSYSKGTEVTVSAIPQEGWTFSNWTGDYEGAEEEITITMDSDYTISAVFQEEDCHHFTVLETEPKGAAEEISYNGANVVSELPITFKVDHGETVYLNAVASDGFIFTHWAVGEEIYLEASISLTVDSNMTVQAHFESVPFHYLEILESEGQGYVYYFDANMTPALPVTIVEEHGITVELTGIPAKGWSFSHWEMNGVHYSCDANIEIDMTEDITVKAHFSESGYFMVDITETEVYAYKEKGVPGLVVIVTVNYTVTNTGANTDTQEILFHTYDKTNGEVVFKDIEPDLTLGSGESYTGSFVWETNVIEHAGWYIVEVASEDDADEEHIQIPSYGRFIVSLFKLQVSNNHLEESQELELDQQPALSDEAAPSDGKLLSLWLFFVLLIMVTIALIALLYKKNFNDDNHRKSID